MRDSFSSLYSLLLHDTSTNLGYHNCYNIVFNTRHYLKWFLVPRPLEGVIQVCSNGPDPYRTDFTLFQVACPKAYRYIFFDGHLYKSIYELANSRLRRDFPRTPGERRLRRRWRKKKLGRLWRPFQGAPASPQMVLKTRPVPWGFQIYVWFLKLDNGKVVSIANGQNHIITDGQTDVTSSTVLVYRYIWKLIYWFFCR